MVDHLGLLISAVVSSGNCGDRDGLRALLFFQRDQQEPVPLKIFADQGYRGIDFKTELAAQGVDLEPVARSPGKGFVLQAKRWIVERTFAWLGKCRRLSKDYELITRSSLSMLYLAMIRLMLRRIVKNA